MSKQIISTFLVLLLMVPLLQSVAADEGQGPDLEAKNLTDNDFNEIENSLSLLSRSKFFIDDTSSLSPSEILSRSRKLKRENPDLGVIFIDYMQLMKADTKNDNRVSEMSEISRSLKALAKEIDVPVVALSQLNRAPETRTGKRPVLADLKPFGKHYMSELNARGGIQPLMKVLLDNGLLHGSCMTVTGETLEENLKNVEPYLDNEIIKSFENPIKDDSHLRIMYGNLAEDGAVAKITGKEGTSFEGKAKVFDSEEDGVEAILNNKINNGDVVVIRYEGPKGGPGMREMLKPTSAIMGLGLGDKIAFITDGRFSGGTHGFVVGHVSPEAADGGLIAHIEDGDTILIDAKNDKLILKVDDDEILKRKAKWKKPITSPKKGVLAKYAVSVKSASLGAITD